MKATATLKTWKKAEKPNQFIKYEVDKTTTITFEANDIDEAELYLYNNYRPAWLVGLTIQMGTDFSLHPVPEYWMNILGKEATPRNIVKELKKQTLQRIADKEAVANGTKKWEKNPISGDWFLVDVK